MRVTALLLGLAVIGIVARQTELLERLFIYFPDRELHATPADRGVGFEDVFFTAPDGVKLHGWFAPGSSDVTWVWLHGNAGNISNRVDNLAVLHQRLGVNIFIFDYRGYGLSEGKPSERGTYLDGVAALAYVRSRRDVDGRKIVLFGRSLGCAVAVEIAARAGAYAVVLESPFTSVRAMARRAYPFLPGVGALVRAKYDSLSKIKDVDAPIMVLHGDHDEIAPFDMGQELFEAANEPKRFYTIEGAGHNDTYLVGGDAYYEALARFVADVEGVGRQ